MIKNQQQRQPALLDPGCRPSCVSPRPGTKGPSPHLVRGPVAPSGPRRRWWVIVSDAKTNKAWSGPTNSGTDIHQPTIGLLGITKLCGCTWQRKLFCSSLVCSPGTALSPTSELCNLIHSLGIVMTTWIHMACP